MVGKTPASGVLCRREAEPVRCTVLERNAALNPFEDYLRELRDIHASGAGVPETSYYPALRDLLNAVGAQLKPKVRCIVHLANKGAGIPDIGLFTPDQFATNSADSPPIGTKPARGVVEAKPARDDAGLTADGKQVTKYWGQYGQVLVTNYRDFLLVGRDAEGRQVKLESFRLAPDEAEFWRAVEQPRKMADEHGERLVEYLKRVMLHSVDLTAPKDVAWYLASYARDARLRIEHKPLAALAAVREALEEALGLKFEGEKGEHFFRSTLVQTLFYGVFSAWALWARIVSLTDPKAKFDWVKHTRSLNVPVLRKLFHELAEPGQLETLNLTEALGWTEAVLNRVDRAAFFEGFEEHHAVQYFYEPFLQAYDPGLRKQLGVWYTPIEIVRYMVARIDTMLREELGLADGLADRNVYVLDPCCGTGAYLVEVLDRIHATLKSKGGDATTALQVKQAALERVFGFEILPAPFVVSHLQLGLRLQSLGAPLSEAKRERAGVFLTNALTGWEPPDGPKKQLSFPELEAERDAADRVKRDVPILVILGNPPYNAFAGVSPAEEQGLVEPYKAGLISDWKIKKFNLDDLYVRFFRLAERRIAERAKPGKGVVAFVSNFSYLADPSFVVMRKRLLGEFDALWLDCMNGDSRETGKLTPHGKPDPSVFSTEYNREGIRVGTTIGLMVRKVPHRAVANVRYREFWGATKRADLLDSLDEADLNASYQKANPAASNRYSFRPSRVSKQYYGWPRVTELCAVPPSNGLMEKRGGALIDIDKKALDKRMRAYFDPKLDWEAYKALGYGLTDKQASFDPKAARARALSAEAFDSQRLVKYVVRPFEIRQAYYTAVPSVWNRARPSLWAQLWEGNEFFVTRVNASTNPEGAPFYFTCHLIDDHMLAPDAAAFAVRIKPTSKAGGAQGRQAALTLAPGLATANLSPATRKYLSAFGLPTDEDGHTAAVLWHHALAVGYSPVYLSENADGVRSDWPRIPLPSVKDTLLSSAVLGRQIADLLDTESDIKGVTTGAVRPELKTIAEVEREGGLPLNPGAGDFDLTAGWGHAGKGGVTMPAKGRVIEHDYTNGERAAIETGAMALGLKRCAISARAPATST